MNEKQSQLYVQDIENSSNDDDVVRKKFKRKHEENKDFHLQ